jgi:hypothetical protein
MCTGNLPVALPDPLLSLEEVDAEDDPIWQEFFNHVLSSLFSSGSSDVDPSAL